MQKKSTVNDLPAALDCPGFGLKQSKKAGLLSTIMRVTLVQLTVAMIFSGVSVAFENHAQEILERKVSLEVSNVSLLEVLTTIEKTVNVKFVYSPTHINLEDKVSLDVSKKRLGVLLSDLLSPRSIIFKVQTGDDYIVLVEKEVGVSSLLPDASLREEFILATISGKVIDASGVPIPGVNILVKGTTNGTTTDGDGRYSLAVLEEDAVLVFSFIGYITQEVSVGGRSVIDVTLAEDVQRLNEVVVVGYGTQKKENLTGSVSTVRFDKDMANRPITSPAQALAGQMPGIWVSEVSGKPGSEDGVLLRIRGWGSLNSSGPMILIDGVEGSLAQINPKEIESMTVLKDAASASIYGSKAANGVVLITTKSGQHNQKTKIDLSSYVGVQSIARKFDLIDNSAEYMEMWNAALANTGSAPIFPADVINDFKNNSDPYLYPNSNFFDEVYHKALISEHNLSFSGGSESTKYYASFNGLLQDGIMRETGTKRYGLSLNLESKLNKWLTIGGRMNTLHRNSKEPYSMENVTYMFVHGAYPFTAPYNADGTFGAVQALGSNGQLLAPQRNPLLDIYDGQLETQSYFTKLNGYADVKFNKDLIFRSNLSIQTVNDVTDSYNEGVMGYTSTGLMVGNHNTYTIGATRSNRNDLTYLWFNTLNFQRTFGDKHDVSSILGFQTENMSNKTSYSARTNPPVAGLTQVDAGTAGVVGEGSMTAFRMMSYFGRLNYAFADKYLFEINARADASSRFAEAHRWGVFPGVSVGWRISDEAFMANQNVISELKLRASWGKLGNQSIVGYWPFLTTISQNFATSYNLNGSLAPGAAVTSLVDESITWETTTSKDLGIEVGVLNNRLFLEANYFDKVTNDIIVQLPIPRTLGGMDSPYENVGKMSNKGIELDVRYSKAGTDRNSFSYSLGANFTYVANKVVKFMGDDSPDQTYLIRDGYSYRTLYAFRAEGIYQSDQEALEHMHANGYKPKAGDLRYQDINGDGRMDFNDYTDIGNTIPKYNFGGSLNFSYKGFDLGILMQGLSGVHMNTLSDWTQPFGVSGGTVTKRWRNAWTPENPNTNIPMLKMPESWNRQMSSFWVTELSFLKVKNIQLGYSFTDTFIKKLGISTLYLYANAQNALTFVNKDYEGFDPERSTFDNGRNNYPLAAVYSMGLNIGF